MWLEFHGDIHKKTAPDAATRARLLRGRAHEKEIITKMEVVEPVYPERDFAAGARATLELMHSRTPLIYQGVLAGDGRVGMPDLLQFDAANNCYIVGDVKASPEAKIEHAMQVAFYTEMLERVQERPAPGAFLILADGSQARIPLDDVRPLYREAIADVTKIKSGESEPRAAFSHACRGCAWREECVPAMSERQDLTLIFGMTPARRMALEQRGIINITDLAAIDANELSTKTELPRETLRRLKLQAAALLEKRPLRLGPFPWKPSRAAIAASIARDPRGTHFAEFIAFRTCKIQDRLDESWHHAEAPAAADEEKAYKKFLRILADDFDAPIYHFGPALPDALATLDARFGKLNDPIARVFARLVDVQSLVRSALVLPTHHYDLEGVANALGVAIPPVAEPAENDTNENLTLALRRRTGGEALAIRNIRVAAYKAWQTAGGGAQPVGVADNLNNNSAEIDVAAAQ